MEATLRRAHARYAVSVMCRGRLIFISARLCVWLSPSPTTWWFREAFWSRCRGRARDSGVLVHASFRNGLLPPQGHAGRRGSECARGDLAGQARARVRHGARTPSLSLSLSLSLSRTLIHSAYEDSLLTTHHSPLSTQHSALTAHCSLLATGTTWRSRRS
eukprot:scaffold9121_cov53-Phaeocystis_antarctica.AAC.2